MSNVPTGRSRPGNLRTPLRLLALAAVMLAGHHALTGDTSQAGTPLLLALALLAVARSTDSAQP